jgi:ribonuclease HI
VNTDGGARGNPGSGGAGIVIRRPDGSVAAAGGAFLGTVTNNVAEYEALIWGLRAARELGARCVRVEADSELAVKQMRGEYRVRHEGLRPLFLEAQEHVRGLERVEFVHVRREDNRDADAMANEAMDARAVVGNAPSPPEPRSTRLFD